MTVETKFLASRTCTAVSERYAQEVAGASVPLSDYAEAGAYVLIAEPGAGKTEAFKIEASRPDAEFVTVRSFLSFRSQEWRDGPESLHGKTLFLDGLDESRAGTSDGRIPLDKIRRELSGLGNPRFRISCRWADWLAANDRRALQEVSPDGEVKVVRLDPLSRQDVKCILSRNHDVEDPEGFIATAKDRGIEGLLDNALNLDLIAKAAAEGKWPDSRLEVFEQACGILVGEENDEHREAKRLDGYADPLLNAGGLLCAVQLISGNAGFTLPGRAEPDDDYPSLSLIGKDAGELAREVLGTRLFVGVAEGKLAPAHRQIAEFLAARHLSKLIDGGLPLGRVLALITGFDGEIMPGFRNFSSWIAVHNKDSRMRIASLVPSWLVYAGDKDTYSADEKRAIVMHLKREWLRNPYCSRSRRWVSGIGRIVSPEIVETLKDMMSCADPSHEYQCYMLLLMQMLGDGDALRGLSEDLFAMVRDESWCPNVRAEALCVLARYSEDGSLEPTSLKDLVQEVEHGLIDDAYDDLLGILLKSLYPRMLSMAEILKHLRKPKDTTAMGEFTRFWTDHVFVNSPPEQLSELLDAIAENRDDCSKFMSGAVGKRTRMAELPQLALENVLYEARGRVDPKRVYDWLGIFSKEGSQTIEVDSSRLQARFDSDTELFKRVLAHAVAECIERGEDCSDVIERRLCGVRPFRDARWCLKMAVASEPPQAATFFLRELIAGLAGGNPVDGLAVEGVRSALAGNAALLEEFERVSEVQVERHGQHVAGTLRESALGKVEVRSDTSAPPKGKSSTSARPMVEPGHLHCAAMAYLGIEGSEQGGTALNRLTKYARQFGFTADILLNAMERSVHREDLPACDEVVRWFDEERVHPAVPPLMAGLHSLEESGRLLNAELDVEAVRVAIAVLYTLPQEMVDPESADRFRTFRPAWFRELLRNDTKLVSDVLCRTALLKLKTGVQQPREIFEMATAADHEDVGRLAALRILEQFPKAETEVALHALCSTLRACLEYCDWSDVESEIENRLERGRLETAERFCWLMAGYMTSPGRHGDGFRAVEADETLLKWLGEFLSLGRPHSNLTCRLAPGDLVFWVETAWAAHRRHGLSEGGLRLVESEIEELALDPSPAATDALVVLAEERNGDPWMPKTAIALERQKSRRREAEFQHRHVEKVVETLKGLRPANVGDLAALVLDVLFDISEEIRCDSASEWRFFWNEDGKNRPVDPRSEEGCRDMILSMLKRRMDPLDVDVQPEGRYVNDNRADIRVSFDGFNVPVEIKRSCHRDVWTAMNEQLIPKYTCDQGASGYGNYLVFWFGDDDECKPRKLAGRTPQSADEVERWLQKMVPEGKEDLISVCVIDVSVPADKKKGRRSVRKK